MKPITKWQADDGAEFNSQAECATYEVLCREVDGIMARLPVRPDDTGCRFSNGHGYLQHDPAAWLSVQRDLARIGRRYFEEQSGRRHFDYVIDAGKPMVHTLAGRLVNDGCPAPVWRAWSRLMCVDSRFREWGQPYYALHPDAAEAFPLSVPYTSAVSC